ncbi:MAG: hypothetical protein M0Q53_15105 [Prolixibacteraceae bacterium]|jgi:hypothetical protein|nr:hypothetical protein [Prolixibacteraceae bacterium]
MQNHELYLPMLLPLWGIFIGIALIVIGFVDKKPVYTYSGWSMLILVGLLSLFYNLFQISPLSYQENSQMSETATILVKAGYLNLAGAALSLCSLLYFRYKNRRYLLMAILTVLFFAIQFFQYYSLIQKPK